MARRKSDQELSNELAAQFHLLRKACAEYDAGDLHEFRNIARALRLILTDDQFGNPSLWNLAGQGNVQIRDSRLRLHPLNIAPYFGLVAIVMGSNAFGCRPLLDNASGRQDMLLNEWLEQVVIDGKDGEVFSRLRLIKAIANTGGATHFPPEIRNYFSKLQDMGVHAIKNGQPIEVKYRDIEKHSLRQIAHEIICAYDSSYRCSPNLDPNSLVVSGIEFVLLPGRQIEMGAIIKKTPSPAIMMPRDDGIEGIQGPVIHPYDAAVPTAVCVCQSGLLYKYCCLEPGMISSEFVDEFRRRHRLGSYRRSAALDPHD